MLLLRLKSAVVGSPLEPAILAVRDAVNLTTLMLHPDLGLLSREGRLIDYCLDRLIKRDDNCLDVGAHIGSFLSKFERLAPDGRHFAVEASATKAGWLRRKFPKVEIFNVAASDRDGEAPFFEDLVRPGFSSLTRRAGPDEQYRVAPVRLAHLDDTIPSDVEINLIKIDIEGHEYEAMQGAQALIVRWRPIILFEAGPLATEISFGFSYRRLFAMFVELDYEIYAALDWRYGRPKLSQEVFDNYRIYPFRAFNYFAIPAERPPQLAGH